LPVRAAAVALGGQVNWDGSKHKITINKGAKLIRFIHRSDIIAKN